MFSCKTTCSNQEANVNLHGGYINYFLTLIAKHVLSLFMPFFKRKIYDLKYY